MKNVDIFVLSQLLTQPESPFKDVKGTEFWLAMGRAKKQLVAERELLVEALKSIDGLVEAEEALQKAKDEKNENFDLTPYKEALLARQEFLMKDNALDCKILPKELLPADLNGQQIEILQFFLKEGE